MRTYPLYIPAGSNPKDIEDELLIKAGVTNKALIDINGKKIIEYVLEAADNSKKIDKIFVVGITQSEIEYVCGKEIHFIGSIGRRMDTFRNLISYMEGIYQKELPRHMIVLSADLPLITGEIIDDDIINLENKFGNNFEKVDLYYPLVEREKVLKKYPHANKRFRNFEEGSYATGDFAIFSPDVLRRKKTMEVFEKIMENRKTMVRLLLKFDLISPIKYLIGKLSIRKKIIPFFREMVYLEMEMLISEHPEICLDLDYKEDLEIMQELVKNKN